MTPQPPVDRGQRPSRKSAPYFCPHDSCTCLPAAPAATRRNPHHAAPRHFPQRGSWEAPGLCPCVRSSRLLPRPRTQPHQADTLDPGSPYPWPLAAAAARESPGQSPRPGAPLNPLLLTHSAAFSLPQSLNKPVLRMRVPGQTPSQPDLPEGPRPDPAPPPYPARPLRGDPAPGPAALAALHLPRCPCTPPARPSPQHPQRPREEGRGEGRRQPRPDPGRSPQAALRSPARRPRPRPGLTPAVPPRAYAAGPAEPLRRAALPPPPPRPRQRAPPPAEAPPPAPPQRSLPKRQPCAAAAPGTAGSGGVASVSRRGPGGVLSLLTWGRPLVHGSSAAAPPRPPTEVTPLACDRRPGGPGFPPVELARRGRRADGRFSAGDPWEQNRSAAASPRGGSGSWILQPARGFSGWRSTGAAGAVISAPASQGSRQGLPAQTSLPDAEWPPCPHGAPHHTPACPLLE